MSILNYLIKATWKGKGDVAKAKADLLGLGKASDKATTSTKKVSGGLGNIKKAAMGLAAAGGIGMATKLLFDFGKASVLAASDAEEAMSKASVVFGETFGDVQDDLKEVATATKRSSYDLIEYAATIQDTLVPLGFARDAAADFSTEITELAIDLGSFNNLETADVVRDLQSALVGNTETLRKYGVVASQAAIEQEALDTGLWDGLAPLDAQTKAQTILQLTIKGTTDAQGDAVRTADGFANSARGLESAWRDYQVLMGQELAPAVATGMSGLTDLIGGLIDVKSAAIEARIGVHEFIIKTEELKLLQGYRDELEGVEDAIDKVGARGRIWAPLATVDTRESLLLLLADYAALNDENQDVTISMRELGVEIERTGVRVNGMGVSWVELNNATAAARKRNDLAVITEQYADLDEKLGNYIGYMPAVVELTEQQKEAAEGLAASTGDLVRETEQWTNSGLAEWIAGVKADTAAQVQYQLDLNEAYKAAAGPVQTILDAQQAAADAPWWKQEEASENLAAANEDLATSYKRMAYDSIYANAEVGESTIDLAVEMGLITPEAAEMRLEFAKTSVEMGKFAESQDFAALSAERQSKAIQGVIDGLYDTAEAATAVQTKSEAVNAVYDDMADYYDREGAPLEVDVGTGQAIGSLGELEADLLIFAEGEYESTLEIDDKEAREMLREFEDYLNEATADRTTIITVITKYKDSKPPGEPYATGGSFVVPPGYPNDTFPIRVTSGERVTVETQSQQQSGSSPGLPAIEIVNHIYGGGADLEDLAETQRQSTLQAMAEVGLA